MGADDTKLRVYNYNTAEKLKTIEDHSDYIRHIVVHPTLPYVLSCSDDDTIKMFDWDKNWAKVNSFQDHEHYIMQLAINPKDPFSGGQETIGFIIFSFIIDTIYGQ